MLRNLIFLTLAAITQAVPFPGTSVNPNGLSSILASTSTYYSTPVSNRRFTVRHPSSPVEDTTSANIASSPDSSLLPGDASATGYAHGYCSFHMGLVNECVHSDTENWHKQIIGNIYSIEDNDRKTVIRYPIGAGRIDAGVILLTGMGDGLRLTYYKDNQVYFAYDGGYWATNTKDEAGAYGLCKWYDWSAGELVCDADHDHNQRTSNIVCIFRC